MRSFISLRERLSELQRRERDRREGRKEDDMGELQEIANLVFIAVVFAFMVAKLISLVVSFKDDNLRIERAPAEAEPEGETQPESETAQQPQLDISKNSSSLVAGILHETPQVSNKASSSSSSVAGIRRANDDDDDDDDDGEEERPGSCASPEFGEEEEEEEEEEFDRDSSREQKERRDMKEMEQGEEPREGEAIGRDLATSEGLGIIGLRGASKQPHQEEEEDKDEGLLSDEDEWEGVESSELEQLFSAAAAYVASKSKAELWRRNLSNVVEMRLYALYKVATEGPCNVPQPSALKMTARAKWLAWQRLGKMTAEAAMEQYVQVLQEVFPEWNNALEEQKMKDSGSSQIGSGSSGMSSVFSSLCQHEGSDDEIKLEPIHSYAREGDTERLVEALKQGVSVDRRDSKLRTPLHWAVDRGHLQMVQLVVSEGADLNAKDVDGQTPLHYAMLCERETVARYLGEHGADFHINDNDGVTPKSLRPESWKWLPEHE